MNLDEYQKKAIVTDTFEDEPKDLMSGAFIAKILGLVGEAGEVAEKFKKIIRDKEGKLNEEDKKEITKELGDVLWYVSVLAHYMEIPLSEVAEGNIKKLYDRKNRGVTHGQGDNR